MSEQELTTSEAQPQTIQQFNESLAAVHAHNDEYSLGKAMARSLFGLIKIGEEDEEDKQPISHSEEQEMARGILDLTSSHALESLGLKITPVRQQAVIFGPQGEEEIGPVRLQLEDGGKFSGFLSGIDPEQVDDDFRKNAAFVTGNVLVEFTDAIANGQDGDFVLETLASAEGLAKGLEHIGLSDSEVTKKLKEYAAHSKTGDLVEFVLAERLQLLKEPGAKGFGPSQWQRDASPKYLQDRWDEVVVLLRKTQANPRAQNLFNQLLGNTKANLDFARQDWGVIKGEYGEGYGQGFNGVFNEVSARLEELGQEEKH